MNPPTGGGSGGDAAAGRRERRTVLAPLPQLGGAAGGAHPAATRPAAEPPPTDVGTPRHPAAASVSAAAEPTGPPAVDDDGGPPPPAPSPRARAPRADGGIPRIARGRRRRDEPAPGEKPDRRLPVYFWFHNVRFLRELRLDMEAAGARPGDLNDSLLVRAVVTALERTGMERTLRACRSEDQVVRAIVARLEGAPEAEVIRMISRLVAAEQGEAGRA